VLELGNRLRSQPAPPRMVWEALTQPRRAGARPWLRLHADEVDPVVVEALEPHLVIWSSIWPSRPHDRVIFDITADGSGSGLRWTLVSDDGEPPPDEVVGHLRYRLNRLINSDLRYSFGQ
jgi:hypothetical protein